MSSTTKNTRKRPAAPEDLMRLEFLHSCALSPDGKHLVYGVSCIDDNEQEHVYLRLNNIDTGEDIQLSTKEGQHILPAWSPDSRRVVFLSGRSGSMQLYVMDIFGGEAQRITNLKQSVSGPPVWSPDGRWIAFTASPEKYGKKSIRRIDSFLYRMDGMGYLEDGVQEIFLMEAGETFGEPKQITRDGALNLSLRWSPDSRELLYLAAFDRSTPRGFDFSIKRVNLEGQGKTVLEKFGLILACGWNKEGDRIIFTSSKQGSPAGTKQDLWIIGAEGGMPECRTSSLLVGVIGSMQPDSPEGFSMSIPIPLSSNGKYAYVKVQEGGSSAIYEIALQGREERRKLTAGERSVELLGGNDEFLLFKSSDLSKPSDLFIYNIENQDERQVTFLNKEYLSRLLQPEVKHLLFPGADGREIEGWLMLPSEGEAPYPAILYNHGGPNSAYGNIYCFDFQMLAGAGYAVLFINYHASSGYGTEFGTSIRGNFGNLEYQDLMKGVDYAVDQGYIDNEHLGVCGLSNGGFLTCWIVGQTNRFKAAAAENCYVDWNSFYGTSDIGVWYCTDQLGGHPHEIPELYRKCSPITYAHNCKTPTLLIAGEEDRRCPVTQSEQFFTVLKQNGCATEFIRIAGGAHAMSMNGPVEARKVQNLELLRWMDRYILGKTDEDHRY